MTSAAEPLPAAPAEEAARAAQEPLAAPVELAAPKRWSFARLRLAAFLGALAAHLAVLYALTREAPSPMAGALGRLLDAVDVSMINATALEARPDMRAPAASATLNAVESKEGAADSKPAPEQLEQKEEKWEPEHLREEPPPVTAAETPQAEKSERREASASSDAGGAAARGDAPSIEKQSAPAAASPGAVREYEGYVIQALAKIKPRRSPPLGTVRIRLQIAPDGQIASLEVIKSSGNKKLDDMALAEVRRARFPRPPLGMTDQQRLYDFAFNSIR